MLGCLYPADVSHENIFRIFLLVYLIGMHAMNYLFKSNRHIKYTELADSDTYYLLLLSMR